MKKPLQGAWRATRDILLFRTKMVQEMPIKPSNSSGLRVLLLLLPFNFFVITFLVILFRLGLICSRFRACSASACASSNFCWTVRAGDCGLG